MLSEQWAAKLKKPNVGKLSLGRFHMTDCQSGLGVGWPWLAREIFRLQLCELIIKAGIWGYDCAVRRKDWDELITGDKRV
jgi:hypothetical protein